MKLRYGAPEEAGMSVECVRHLSHLAQGWVEQGMTPALVVLVARKGVIVLHEAFGSLTPDPDSPPLPRDAIFPILSISKPFTATAAMILVNDGLLGLNRPVQEYVPEFEGEGKQEVMVHHLLTHTSGLRDEDVHQDVADKLRDGRITALPYLASPRFEASPAGFRYLSQAFGAPLSYRPGAEMSYSTIGFLLLGEVLRRVSGLPLPTFLRQRIFDPLELRDTHAGLPETLRPRLVRRRPNVPGAFFDDPTDLEKLAAGGGLYSTARDLATFGQMFLSRGCYGDARILSPAAVAEMTRNQTPGVSASYKGEFFPESSWGLGWDVHSNKRSRREPILYSPRAVSHSGLGGTFLWTDPVYDMVGAYLSIQIDVDPNTDSPTWRADLFANAATAAIDEPDHWRP
jgi:CubicO group peptidase (beta-lactamase class C family)